MVDPKRSDAQRQAYRAQQVSRRQPTPPARNAAPRPARPDPDGLDESWYRVPRPIREQSHLQPRPDADKRAALRRLRARRRKQRRTRLLAVVAGILLLAGIITLLLPADPSAVTREPTEEGPSVTNQLVAPLPYGGGDATASAPAVDWGTVGPIRQTENFTFTAAPESAIAVPEFGRVDLSWFADAAFLGDSLTVGFIDYNIDVSDALICAYIGTSPNQVVNRATLNHSRRGEEIPMDVLTAAQPKKLYILMGTNALVAVGGADGYLAYYGRMLDELREALPNTMVFVQSVLPVRPEALEKAPGLAPEYLRDVNASLAAMCVEKGCYYLDLNAEFADASGALQEDYNGGDGIHLNVAGYRKWVTFLCTHVPYAKTNPYQVGSTYYLSPDVRTLLQDLP